MVEILAAAVPGHAGITGRCGGNLDHLNEYTGVGCSLKLAAGRRTPTEPDDPRQNHEHDGH